MISLGRSQIYTFNSIRKFSSAIAFPGQGTQKQGMLRDLYQAHPSIVKPILQECDEALGEKISDALIQHDSNYNITLTENAQPLLLIYGYTVYKVLCTNDEQPRIKYALGHSLGEYTAWTASRILPLRDAVQLVRKRGRAMQEATESNKSSPTGMTMLLLPRKPAPFSWPQELNRFLKPFEHRVSLATVNAESQIVLSGELTAIDSVVSSLKKDGIRVKSKPLDVSGPFHSVFMAPAKQDMKALLPGLQSSLKWPGDYTVVSNITGRPFGSLDEVKHSISETLTNPVNWMQSIQYIEPHVDRFYQVGSGKYVQLACGDPKKEVVYI